MDSCYTWDYDNKKPHLGDSRFNIPCPSGGGCCAPGDTCLSTFMCKHAQPAPNANRPDYYVGACTDPNYSASACNKVCASFAKNGVVYNSETQRWACCGTDSNNDTTCATPSTETFQLLPPDELPIIGVAGGAPAPSTTTSVGSSATSQAASTSTTESSSDRLSIDADVGLGVGIGLTGALVAALLGYLFLRRRREARKAVGGLDDAALIAPSPKPDMYYTSTKQDLPPIYTNRPLPIQNASFRREPQRTHEMGEYSPNHSELPTLSNTQVELA